MAIDLNSLLETAFFEEDVQNGSEAIERLLEKFEEMERIGARLFEMVVPDEPDEAWLRDGFVAGLIYFCESEGTPVPRCGGTVVALYVGAKLYGIPAERVVSWASAQLDTPIEQLRTRYGTHEGETALR
jgi:hypothetical protein